MNRDKIELRERRHLRVRKKVTGTQERPRLTVYKSLNHMYAQIIDDTVGRTLVSASTLEKEMRQSASHKGNVKSASLIGDIIAKRAKDKGIQKVVFDKGGFKYHGRVEAVARAAREAGLEF
ncbi:MAG: 50S ribosomal protein L18 [Nitrospirae bacterium]|nr:50S ribosomal protein L18 [Nitrospirota bacterium]MBF0534276.1 50S ribosomal protein L18 [Nitrospirota bacterium]MBF0615743.1 50S ribosomal protein L18 [Nitrospirota bacterium]